MSESSSSSKRPKLENDVPSSSPSSLAKANILMIGTGEYTTGYVGGTAADSDKGAGVVALTMFDLRRRDKVDRVGMCGVNVRSIYVSIFVCDVYDVSVVISRCVSRLD